MLFYSDDDDSDDDYDDHKTWAWVQFNLMVIVLIFIKAVPTWSVLDLPIFTDLIKLLMIIIIISDCDDMTMIDCDDMTMIWLWSYDDDMTIMMIIIKYLPTLRPPSLAIVIWFNKW